MRAVVECAVPYTLTVADMTCANCVRHVREAIGALSGVTDVRVDLDTGRVEYDARHELPQADVAAALDEAGYTLA
jgi:copper chaperone